MNEVLAFEEQEITAYDEFRSQLAELETNNSKAVFDYADPKGNKEARSHIHKLRRTKTAVDKVRKEQKQASLEYGRRVDGQAKEIISQIESMIEVHQQPIDEIENKEKERVIAHEAAYERLLAFEPLANLPESSDSFKQIIHDLKALEPDEHYEEFTGAALTAYKKSLTALESALQKAEQREAEQAELEKLRAEKEERDRKEREERIAREATEAAERKAETDKIEAERIARENAERLEREKQEAIEREERAKRDAEESERRHIEERKQVEERAKKAVAEAEEKQKQDALAAARLERQEAEKREANKKHKAAINNSAVDALVAGGVSKTAAKDAITLIAKREIPNVTISY